jgi:2-haloalkanoic acid dehalogenase type II
MLNYEWITFDCYGTLIDWEAGISMAFEKVAKTSYMPFDRQKILSLYRKHEMEEEFSYKKYREVLTRVAKRICTEMKYKPVDYNFLAESLPRWRPFADTNQVLTRLSRYCKLGVLSNVDVDLFTETRKHFPVPFQMIITAQDVGSYKPEPQHFLEARKRIGTAKWIHAAQSFYHDVTPCNRLRIETAWINRNQEETDSKIVPIFNKPSLFAFANWIEEID